MLLPIAILLASFVAQPSDPKPTASEPRITIEIRDGYRYFTANGLPNHATGEFPNRNNPNSISPQDYHLRVTLTPKPRESATPARRAEGPQLFGVAVNGVVFDPGTAEFWKNDRSNGWRIEAILPPGVRGLNLGLDSSNAHVQPNGAYHYHSIPIGLLQKLDAADTPAERDSQGIPKRMLLVGWAADGFPIYGPYAPADPKDPKSPLKKLTPSYRLKTATRPAPPDGPGGSPNGIYTQDWEFAPGAGDLDEFNGRTGPTPEFPDGTFYYVLTDAFPSIPRTFKGEPDPSFSKRPEGGPGGPKGPGKKGAPPR